MHKRILTKHCGEFVPTEVSDLKSGTQIVCKLNGTPIVNDDAVGWSAMIYEVRSVHKATINGDVCFSVARSEPRMYQCNPDTIVYAQVS